MKHFIYVICFLGLLACKKTSTEELQGKQFVLSKAIVSPAMFVNGKAETNYLNIDGAGVCLNYNYTISFSFDGTYTISSNGPLCDMVRNQKGQKWIRNGNSVTLTHAFMGTIEAKLEGDQLSYKVSFPKDGVTYSLAYHFKEK